MKVGPGDMLYMHAAAGRWRQFVLLFSIVHGYVTRLSASSNKNALFPLTNITLNDANNFSASKQEVAECLGV